jgi:hypothetical protein
VRKFSNRIGSIIGVTGGFYAVRRSLALEEWDPAFPPDFYAALRSIEEGFRVIEDERVVARYYTPKSDRDEMNRKVRTITRGMWALFSNAKLLNPFRYGLPAIQLVSHKILRWITPFLLMLCFAASVILWLDGLSQFYTAIFWLQAFLYGFGTISLIFVWKLNVGSSVLRTGAMSMLFNIAIFLSWKNILMGKKIVAWEPTARSPR